MRWFLFFLFAIAATGCGGGTDVQETASSPSDTPTVTAATESPVDDATPADARPLTVVHPNPSSIVFFPAFVAESQGLFDEAGLDVTFETVDGSGAVLQTLASGRAEIGAVGGPGPVLAANERGSDMVAFYNLFPGGLFSLVVPEDSDIQNPEALSGTTIGVGTAEGGEVSFTRAVLEQFDLNENEDYEFLSVGDGGTAVAAFERDNIQAYAAAVVDEAVMISAGFPVRDITPTDLAVPPFSGMYVASSMVLEERSDALTAFVDALIRAVELTRSDPQAALDGLAELRPDELEDRDFADALLSAVNQKMDPVGDGGFGFTPDDNWQAWLDVLTAAGETSLPTEELPTVYTNEFVSSESEN